MIGTKIYAGSSNDCYIATEEYAGCKGCAFAAENLFTDVCCDVYHSHDYCCGIIWIKQQPVETQNTTCNQTKGEPEMNTDKTANTSENNSENTTEEPKYTLAEFIEAYDAYIADEDTTLATRDEFMRNYLLRFSSPEYQEYLRLKAIFG